jgi:hypothetical protein
VNNGLKGLRGDLVDSCPNPGDRREYSGERSGTAETSASGFFYTGQTTETSTLLGDFTGSDASAEGLDGNLANLNGCVAPAHRINHATK